MQPGAGRGDRKPYLEMVGSSSPPSGFCFLCHSWALKPTPKSQSVSVPLSPKDSGHGAVGQTTKKRAVPERGAGPLSLKHWWRAVTGQCLLEWSWHEPHPKVLADICPQPHPEQLF